MKKSWQMIPKILSGKKTIESRWYQTKRTPWNKIKSGDIVYFKNSGESITASAVVEKVLQFEFHNQQEIKKVLKLYCKQMCLVNTELESWAKIPNYCVLIFLKNPKQINRPYKINKTGFGMATAWTTVQNINMIKI